MLGTLNAPDPLWGQVHSSIRARIAEVKVLQFNLSRVLRMVHVIPPLLQGTRRLLRPHQSSGLRDNTGQSVMIASHSVKTRTEPRTPRLLAPRSEFCSCDAWENHV